MDALDLIDGIAALSHPSEELLYDLIHRRLSAAGSEAVLDHLTRCAHCRELAEIFGWSPIAADSANIVQLPVGAGTAHTTRHSSPAHVQSRAAWRSAQAERLAASDAETVCQVPTAGAADTDLVQLIPGATHGDAALGYLCGGGIDIVVTGAGNGPAKVLLDNAQYEVRDGTADKPRVVEGLTRKDVAVWLASGRHGRFTMVYP